VGKTASWSKWFHDRGFSIGPVGMSQFTSADGPLPSQKTSDITGTSLSLGVGLEPASVHWAPEYYWQP